MGWVKVILTPILNKIHYNTNNADDPEQEPKEDNVWCHATFDVKVRLGGNKLK